MTRQVGVEEELLLVDPDTGCPSAIAGTALSRWAAAHPDGGGEGPGGVVEEEFQQEQIETDTRPCTSMEDLAQQVCSQRAEASDAARAAGGELAALATTPMAVVPTLTPKARYRQMVREYGLTAAEALSCGVHVHVEVDGDDEGVAVLDRIRGWLPVLLALTANSPFYQGQDSGYESFRSQIWNRWPSAGPTELFGSAQAYRDTVDDLVATGAVLDVGMVYFDARLAAAYPTVEIRVGDVCQHPDDTVLLALTANSPFYQGQDSGYESFRSQIWNRWPSAGPTELFGSAQAYRDTIDDLVATGALLDVGMVYFDARLAAAYPTVEIRVGDVCQHPDDTVLLAALCRGLVSTAAAQAKAGEPAPPVRSETIRVSTWRAGRSGVGGSLVDPRTMRPAPAEHVVDALLDHVRAALEDSGDLKLVDRLLSQLRERGNGAQVQRRVFRDTGRLEDVVRAAVGATVQGCTL